MIWLRPITASWITKSGMTPKQQLEAIYKAVAPLYKERDKTYAELKKQLTPYGVCGLGFKELEQSEKKYVKKYFREQVLPVLSRRSWTPIIRFRIS